MLKEILNKKQLIILYQLNLFIMKNYALIKMKKATEHILGKQVWFKDYSVKLIEDCYNTIKNSKY